MKNWLWDKILDSFVGKVAKDPRLCTTVLVFVAAAIIAMHVDVKQVLGGNVDAIATGLLAIVVAVWGWYTNRKAKEPATK